MKIIWGLEHFSCEEKTDKFEVAQPEDEKSSGRPYGNLSIKGIYKQDRKIFFTRVCSDRIVIE